jgi:ABC-type phosphate transport system substrate-binding protein
MLRYYLILPLLFAMAAVAAFATSVQTASVQTASVQTASVQTAGVQTAGVQTAGVQTAGVQTVNAKTSSAKTAGAKTAGAKAASEQTANEQTANEQTANEQTDVVVVVSSKNPITSLTAEQVTKIFLGKVVTFPNGQTAFPIDQPEGSAIRDEFYTKVAHKNPSQLTAYWAKVIFTGDGRPPMLLVDNIAVRKAIGKNPNAIGYIDKSAVNRSVKVVLEP